MKKCPRCKKNKTLDQFYNGTNVYCKPCASIKGSEYYRAHPEKAKQYQETRKAKYVSGSQASYYQKWYNELGGREKLAARRAAKAIK